MTAFNVVKINENRKKQKSVFSKSSGQRKRGSEGRLIYLSVTDSSRTIVSFITSVEISLHLTTLYASKILVYDL